MRMPKVKKLYCTIPIKFSFNTILDLRFRGEYFGFVSEKEIFKKLLPEQVITIIAEASTIVEKFKNAGYIHNEKQII